MEQLMNFSVNFITRSMNLTLEAEDYYKDVLTNIEKEFARAPDAAIDTTVQKTKKSKQAVEVRKEKDRDESSSSLVGDGNNKENVNRTNAIERQDSEETTAVLDSTANQRPVRVRRTKLTNLRESILSGEKKAIKIKKEPVDKPATKKQSPPVEPVVVESTPVTEKRKSNHDEANLSTESNKKLDESVELITKKPETIDVSDDEAEMMPPPSLPAPKARKPRTKKQSASQPTVSASVMIKEEPIEEEEVLPKRSTRSKVATKKAAALAATVAAASKSKKAPEVVVAVPEIEGTELFEAIVPKVRNSSMANLSSVSTETSVTTAQPVVMSSQPVTEKEKKSKARTKSKKPQIDKVTKEVIPEPAETEVAAEAVETRKSASTVVAEEIVAPPPPTQAAAKKTTKKAAAAAMKKASSESLYEDAQNDPKMFSSQISLENVQKQTSIEKAMVPEMAPPPAVAPVAPMDVDMESPNVNDETFVRTVTTPVVAKSVAPVSVTPQLDSTFNVVAAKKNSLPHDSIMTEDLSMAAEERPIVKQESIESSPPRKPVKAPKPTAASAKKAHEIFNPFVQSPVKAKVDAYERHAKESKIPVTPKYVHVPKLPAAVSQPLPMRNRDNDTTPLKAHGLHPLLGSTTSDQTGNKLAHMKKVLGKGLLSGSGSDSARGSSSTLSSSSGSSKSLARPNSAEDAKKIANALQSMAEEKKRKREEKQRLAQLNREKMEKEKKEQLDRLAKEREEKAKKFLQEKTEQAKLEKKKQAMARLAMENSQQMKIKEMMMKQKSVQSEGNGYGWDLLRSEDSTDDEEKVNKLPPPPAWSRDPLRTKLANLQSLIPSNLVDTMFGLKPMSPDLREIFPDIDPKLLKRNSSMIWKTPPRFSRIERP